MRILVVEDDSGTRELIEIILHARGHSVTACETAERALEKYAQEPFSLAVVDWMLPGMNGLDLCRNIRSRATHSNSTLLVCTAKNQPEDLEAVLNAGADDYLPKPFDPDLFNIRIRIAERQANSRIERKLIEDSFNTLVDANLIGIVFWNSDGSIREANDAFLKMVQYSKDDLHHGRINLNHISPPEYKAADDKAATQINEQGRCDPYEKEYIRKDGERIPVLFGAAALKHKSGNGVAFLLDLSNKRVLEAQIRQSQKMEAVGQLAGGIAHDFNNLLTIIIGRSELLLTRITNDSKLTRDVGLIKSTGERAATLTRQLLQFSRRQVLQPKVENLGKIVSEVEEMLHRLIGETIDFCVLPSKSVRKVMVDCGQLQQVVLNLVVNARDAMPQGGKITVETADVDLSDEYAKLHADVVPGPHVMLAVTDTGCGMSEKTKAHLFEPFFTTKEQGKGTGLGLSTVYGIVKQSGGHIWVYSEPGYGTSFKVYFPAAQREAPTVSSPVLASVKSGGETILIAEDEAGIADLIGDLLREQGYNVLVAPSSEMAVQLASSVKGDIDLLLTDVVMPQLSGKDLAHSLTESRPAMKVLFMSGYTSDAIVHHGVLDNGIEFLEKPFSPAVLCRRVREVLDGKKSASVNAK